MNNFPIGIFDSGIGGLTVTKQIITALPDESFIYIGDTARIPYGPRSKEVITKFALEMASFLVKKKVKAIVVACNTISALSYEEIKASVYPIPILGVIKPVVRYAIQVTKNKKIGVIGTVGTIKSGAYQQLLKFYNSDAQIYSSACPLFVPIAEEGLAKHKITELIAKDYLKELIDNKIDTLILGCTHYPLLFEAISKVVGKDVKLIDPAKSTALMLKELLVALDLESDGSQKAEHEFFVTDAPERVHAVASKFFGEELDGKIEKVSIGEE